MNKLMLLSAVMISLCASCASFPIPNDQKAASEAAYRGAQEAGADAAPQARLAMQLSLDENAQANQAIQNGDNRRAAALFNRARADAELAVGLSRQAQMDLAAQQEAQTVASLRNPAP